MNKSQLAAVKHLTSRIYLANTMTNGEMLNGNVNFVAENHLGHVMVTASNTEAHRWYEKHILVIAFVGPRGGVRFGHVEGVPAALIK